MNIFMKQITTVICFLYVTSILYSYIYDYPFSLLNTRVSKHIGKIICLIQSGQGQKGHKVLEDGKENYHEHCPALVPEDTER